MLEVHGHAITFYFFYTQDGEGDTGLTVTCNIRKKEADGTKTTLVTDGACTEWFGGLYYYMLATGSVASEGDYIGISHTDDANTDQKDLPAIWVIDKANLEDIGDILVDTGTTLPAVLDAIKGTGWTDEDLVAIKEAVDSVQTWTAANISASVTSGKITQIRGDTWDFDIPDLTLDSNLIQLAIKETKLDADAQALLLIDTATGLIYVNGAEVGVEDQGKASLSYVGTTLTVVVDASITAQLPTAGNYHYGIQSVTAAGVVSESYGGTFTITADTVRATA